MATAEWFLAALLVPVHAADQASVPDTAMLEFLATFANENGQLVDPQSIEAINLPETPKQEQKSTPMPKQEHRPPNGDRPKESLRR